KANFRRMIINERLNCSEDFDGYKCQIVMLMGAGGEVIDPLEEGVNNRRGAQVGVFDEKFQNALFAEFDSIRGRSVGFGKAIGIKEDHIAFFQVYCFTLVLLLVKDAEQQAARFESAPFT